MRIPARQVAHLKRHVSGTGTAAVYDPPRQPRGGGIPFRVHGWSTVRGEDAADEGVPVSWVELYVPDRIVHAETGEDLGPVIAADLIELPDLVRGAGSPAVPEVPGFWKPGTPEVPGYTIPGTPAVPGTVTGAINMIQRISFTGAPSAGTNYFNVFHEGQKAHNTQSNPQGIGFSSNTDQSIGLQHALRTLGLVDVTVRFSQTGSPRYDVEFGGANAGLTMPMLTASPNADWWTAGTVQVSVAQQAVAGTMTGGTPATPDVWVPPVPATADTWVPPVPAVPAIPPGPVTIFVPHYIQGYPERADRGLTGWRAGQTLVLKRV